MAIEFEKAELVLMTQALDAGIKATAGLQGLANLGPEGVAHVLSGAAKMQGELQRILDAEAAEAAEPPKKDDSEAA